MIIFPFSFSLPLIWPIRTRRRSHLPNLPNVDDVEEELLTDEEDDEGEGEDDNDVNMNDDDRLRWSSKYLDPIEVMYQAYAPLYTRYIVQPRQYSLEVVPHPSIVGLMLEQRQSLDTLYQQVQQHEERT